MKHTICVQPHAHSRCPATEHRTGTQPQDTYWVLSYRSHIGYLATGHIRTALAQNTCEYSATGHIVDILPQSTQWLLRHGIHNTFLAMGLIIGAHPRYTVCAQQMVASMEISRSILVGSQQPFKSTRLSVAAANTWRHILRAEEPEVREVKGLALKFN